jgi:hypothetical protein
MRLCSTFRRFACLLLVASAAWLPAQSFDLDKGREPVVSLNGLWRFQPGDSPVSRAAKPGDPQTPLWAQPTFDDSSWPLLLSGRSWSTQGYTGLSGFAWYRFTVTIPAGNKPTSLMLAPIISSYQVYVDGQLAGGSGKMPPTILPNTLISYRIFPLAPSGSASERTVQVAIRVWHSPLWAGYVGGGPFFAGHLAGDPKLLESEQRHHQFSRNITYVDEYAYCIIAALIGIAILCLFLIRPAETEYLWFALMLLAEAADNALSVCQEIYSWPAVPINDLLDGVLVAVTIVSFLCFFPSFSKSGSGGSPASSWPWWSSARSPPSSTGPAGFPRRPQPQSKSVVSSPRSRGFSTSSSSERWTAISMPACSFCPHSSISDTISPTMSPSCSDRPVGSTFHAFWR